MSLRESARGADAAAAICTKKKYYADIHQSTDGCGIFGLSYLRKKLTGEK